MFAERVQNSTFAASVGGAITILAVWAIETTTGEKIPPEVSSALTAIIMALLTHYVPDAKQPDTAAPAGGAVQH